MEYEFIHDAVTGIAQAKFSFEHQVIGPWLEVEVGGDVNKLTHVLKAMNDVKSGKCQDMRLVGCEYSLLISADDIHIHPNALVNGQHSLPEHLVDDELNIEHVAGSYCGSDDFRELLLSWAKFNRMN